MHHLKQGKSMSSCDDNESHYVPMAEYKSGSSCVVSSDDASEKERIFTVSEGNILRSYGFWRHESTSLIASPVSPLPEDIISHLSSNAKNEKELNIPPLVDCVSSLVYLAVFGILGVLSRYFLRKLFGPDVAGVTEAHHLLYPDLPSNMVGSFLMGWCGVVFKGNIFDVSRHLAVGLTTGYLGSLTTFSAWNQSMLDLIVNGHWLFSVVGFLIGLFLIAYSLRFGIGTAKCFETFLKRTETGSCRKWRVDTCKRHLIVMVVLTLMLGALLSLSGIQFIKEYGLNGSDCLLCLACLFAPLGVWTRWYLARLNGHGLGKGEYLKWIPFGTLIANVSACCVSAALSGLNAHGEIWATVSGAMQLGFSGCLSTVSTFIAEYNAMEEKTERWRAYAYALVSILSSVITGSVCYYVAFYTYKYAG